MNRERTDSKFVACSVSNTKSSLMPCDRNVVKIALERIKYKAMFLWLCSSKKVKHHIDVKTIRLIIR